MDSQERAAKINNEMDRYFFLRYLAGVESLPALWAGGRMIDYDTFDDDIDTNGSIDDPDTLLRQYKDAVRPPSTRVAVVLRADGVFDQAVLLEELVNRIEFELFMKAIARALGGDDDSGPRFGLEGNLTSELTSELGKKPNVVNGVLVTYIALALEAEVEMPPPRLLGLILGEDRAGNGDRPQPPPGEFIDLLQGFADHLGAPFGVNGKRSVEWTEKIQP